MSSPDFEYQPFGPPLPIVQRSGDPDTDIKELMMAVINLIRLGPTPTHYKVVEGLAQGVRIGVGVGIRCSQATQEQLLMILRNPMVMIDPMHYARVCHSDATIIETVEYLCNPQYPASNPYALPESSQ